ncbi:MAG: macro domain-containing protein [Clostridiales bacterium]|jgi:O-acetyl-ADP-ribose deacetylase (regulator of RNase III)|nr:macro domain-containing protein [Clostridiales bacterium]
MPFTIVKNDITKMNVDCIVNAANTELQMGGGVCGAIFREAGVQKLQTACNKLSPIKTGEAVITPGFDLQARYIIHTAGPKYYDGNSGEEALLFASYTNSLKIAVENGCESIAFPLISSGIYGYPKSDALRVAKTAISEFLKTNELDIYLAVFDRDALDTSKALLGEVSSYIDKHLEQILEAPILRSVEILTHTKAHRAPQHSLESMVGNLDESFSTTLLRLIDAKGKTDVEIYKRANLDRKLFSKIRSNDFYMPSKRTAIALAIALELSLDESNDLLRRAGFTLSHSQKFDLIVEYFIVNGKYDIFEINEVLFEYDQQVLGG